ncbi:acetate--CoA ligase [Alicyclobacillus sp. TC]|uniref:acetate--CoA ligase n=1 Tax=Alicyclobacillus sp. TC TaxID=2606450 RepID=UPI0019344832|nr:acetate--CoA ligase [Alicyclobacillus sp. TC]QRF24077.1 acetate--CoA ligase [Alicyclobacillus sp. TC]
MEIPVFLASDEHYHPSDKYRNSSYIQNMQEYLQLYQESIEHPEQFWNRIADELRFLDRKSTVWSGSMPDFSFFPESLLNVCDNCVDRHAENPAFRNKVALFWEGEPGDKDFLTYAMLQQQVSKFANVLRSLGLQPGDVVSVYMQNLLETYVVLLACLRIGVVYNTVFAGFSAEALRERIVASKAKLVICSNASYRRGKVLPLKDTVDLALQGVDSVEHVIVFRRIQNLATPMTTGRDLDYEELMKGSSPDCPVTPMEANAPGLLIFTSGTSGKPKGIVHAGGGFLLGTYAYSKYQLDLQPQDIYWNTADIGWLTSHIFVLVGGLAMGATTLLYEGALDYPYPGRLYEMIERYQVNKLFSAPTAYRMLMKHGEDLAKSYQLDHVQLLASVGEPLNPEAWHFLRRVFGQGQTVINNTWGQTETGGTPLASLPGAVAMRPGSCGVPFFGHHLDIVDQNGCSLPDNTPGFLVIRSIFPTLARDIFGDRHRYLQSYFSQLPGAYFTGDSAIRDSFGHYWVLGRVDDVINVSGHRISTMEMESALIQHPAVVEAAVVGEPDSLKGMVPVAFVTLDKTYSVSENIADELKEKIVQDIGAFARPSQILFVDVMPKTRSGKIIRRMLREILQTGDMKGDVTGLEDVDVLETLLEQMQRPL